MMLLEIGGRFPGNVPDAPDGGGVFEILEDGSLFLIVQVPKPNKSESKALAAGFSSYSFYRLPVAPYPVIMTWLFPAPIRHVETPFHAGLYSNERLLSYLAKPPEQNNALTCVILDGPIIKALRIVGLRHEMVHLLYEAVTSFQLPTPIKAPEYDRVLHEMYKRFTPKDLYDLGQHWAQPE